MSPEKDSGARKYQIAGPCAMRRAEPGPGDWRAEGGLATESAGGIYAPRREDWRRRVQGVFTHPVAHCLIAADEMTVADGQRDRDLVGLPAEIAAAATIHVSMHPCAAIDREMCPRDCVCRARLCMWSSCLFFS